VCNCIRANRQARAMMKVFHNLGLLSYCSVRSKLKRLYIFQVIILNICKTKKVKKRTKECEGKREKRRREKNKQKRKRDIKERERERRKKYRNRKEKEEIKREEKEIELHNKRIIIKFTNMNSKFLLVLIIFFTDTLIISKI